MNTQDQSNHDNAPTEPSEAGSVQRLVRARYGPPSEEAGECEMCSAKGPVWIAEEDITWNQIPLCAKCFDAAPRPNAQADL